MTLRRIEREHACVFTDSEILELRRMPSLLKWVLGIFCAILAVIFVPVSMIIGHAEKIGNLTAVTTERQRLSLEFQKQQYDRMKEI